MSSSRPGAPKSCLTRVDFPLLLLLLKTARVSTDAQIANRKSNLVNGMDPAQIRRDFKPSREFFVGIDSDGCIFDSMEIKHKECFAPMFVKHFHLQAVSRYAREVWEFVNLYSKTRGANRFPALVRALNLLRERPQVSARKVRVADTKALEEWIARESKLGNATLAADVK